MPVSKLKNLVLLVLLLANLALLALLGPDRLSQAREDAALRQSLCDLYAGQQVSLDPAVVPDTVTIYALELAQDPDAAAAAAAALLGQELTLDDSSRFQSVYRANAGQCVISRSGAFRASLEDRPEVRDLAKDAGKTLHAMGFQYSSLTGPQRLRAGFYTLTAAQTVLGVPVFSQGLTLTYANDRLVQLEGVFYTGAGTLTRISDQPCISAADALVAFLSARIDLGWVGSAVTGMTQGYVRSETAGASVHLTPVWRLETDTGSFDINGITGEVTARASDA